MMLPKTREDLFAALHVAAVVLFGVLMALQVNAGEQSKPANVVSIGGSVTEIVYALGQQHRLIARDSTSFFPEGATALPDVGYIRALSPEGVLSVGPELIIAEEGAGPTEAVTILQQSSVPYVEVPEVYSPAGVADKIRVVAEALGVAEDGNSLAASVDEDLQRVLKAVASQRADKRRVLFVLSTQGGRILASGRDTAAAAIIDLSGATNVIDSFTGYKPVTAEAIAAAQPDLILMMARRQGHTNSNEELWAMPALAQTPAAANDAVVRIDGLLLLGFGPRTPQAIEALHKALYEGS